MRGRKVGWLLYGDTPLSKNPGDTPLSRRGSEDGKELVSELGQLWDVILKVTR